VARDEPESLIFREELTSTMFVIRDIASDVRQYGNCSRKTMARKRDKERAEQDARLEDFSRILERAKADLVAGGETVLTPEEWELPSPERLRLVIERHETQRAATKRTPENASD